MVLLEIFLLGLEEGDKVGNDAVSSSAQNLGDSLKDNIA